MCVVCVGKERNASSAQARWRDAGEGVRVRVRGREGVGNAKSARGVVQAGRMCVGAKRSPNDQNRTGDQLISEDTANSINHYSQSLYHLSYARSQPAPPHTNKHNNNTLTSHTHTKYTTKQTQTTTPRLHTISIALKNKQNTQTTQQHPTH